MYSGCIVNGVRDLNFYSFSLNSPNGHKTIKEPKIKLFKKINKSVLSHTSFYLEEDEQKPVDFNREKTFHFVSEWIYDFQTQQKLSQLKFCNLNELRHNKT